MNSTEGQLLAALEHKRRGVHLAGPVFQSTPFLASSLHHGMKSPLSKGIYSIKTRGISMPRCQCQCTSTQGSLILCRKNFSKDPKIAFKICSSILPKSVPLIDWCAPPQAKGMAKGGQLESKPWYLLECMQSPSSYKMETRVGRK